jgi:hypothetical protein
VRCSHGHVEKEKWLGCRGLMARMLHGASEVTLAHHDSHTVSHHETPEHPSSLAYIDYYAPSFAARHPGHEIAEGRGGPHAKLQHLQR